MGMSSRPLEKARTSASPVRGSTLNLRYFSAEGKANGCQSALAAVAVVVRLSACDGEAYLECRPVCAVALVARA
jgi:hypothetical protein